MHVPEDFPVVTLQTAGLSIISSDFQTLCPNPHNLQDIVRSLRS